MDEQGTSGTVLDVIGEVNVQLKGGIIEVEWATIQGAFQYELAFVRTSDNEVFLQKITKQNDKKMEKHFFPLNCAQGQRFYCRVTALDYEGDTLCQEKFSDTVAANPLAEERNRDRSIRLETEVDVSADGAETVPKNVKTRLDDRNPSNVIISWEDPNFIPEEYEINISSDGYCAKKTTKKRYETFTELDFGVEYTFSVTGLYKGMKGVSSRTALTTKADDLKPRSPEVFLHPQDPYYLTVKWKEPVFPPGKYNVLLFQKGQSMAEKRRKPNACETSFPFVKPDTEYFCTISSMYGDYKDDHVTTQSLKTPQVLIHCAWIDKHLVRCSWPGGNGKYTVYLKYNGKMIQDSTVQPFYQFNYEKKKMKLGDEFEMKIEAKYYCYTTKFQKLLLGDDTRPRQLKTMRCIRDPFAIDVQWIEAKTQAAEYRVTAWRSQKYKDLEDHVYGTNTTLHGLKLDCEYNIIVTPLLDGKQEGLEASLQISTISRNDTEPKEVEVFTCSTYPWKAVAKWICPTVEPQEYEVVCTEVQSKMISTNVTRTSETEVHFAVKCGKNYVFTLTTIYTNGRRGGQKTLNFKSTIENDITPKNVQTSVNERDKFALDVKWDPATFTPAAYAVSLRKGREVIETKYIFDRDITFCDLAPNTTYFCHVACSYKARDIDSDTLGPEVRSNKVATDDSKPECETMHDRVVVSWKGSQQRNNNFDVQLVIQGNNKSLWVNEPRVELKYDEYKLNMGMKFEFSVSRGKNFKLISQSLLVGEDIRPGQPDIVLDDRDPFKITATWAPPKKHPKLYEASITKGGVIVGKIETKETRASFSELTPGTQYSVTVTPIYPAMKGLRELSNVLCTRNCDMLKPESAFCKIHPSDPFQLDVSWKRASFKATKYEICLFSNETGSFLLKDVKAIKRSTQTSFMSLSLGPVYYCTVTALYVDDGRGDPIETNTVDTKNDTACKRTLPRKPEIVEDANNPFLIELQWQIPDHQTAEFSLEIHKDTNSHCTSVKGTKHTEFISMIGQEVWFTIQSIYKNGKGLVIASEKLQTSSNKSTRLEDINVYLKRDNPFVIILEWNPPDFECEKYEIQLIKENRELCGTEYTTKERKAFSSLEKGTTYHFIITGMYKNGAKGHMCRSKVITTARDEDESPRRVTAIANNRNPFELKITWSPTTVTPSSYAVCILQGSKSIATSETSDTEYTFSSLEPGQKYRAKVVAVYTGGKTSAPAFLEGITTANKTLLEPSDLEVKTISRKAIAQWKKPLYNAEIEKYTCILYEGRDRIETQQVNRLATEVTFFGLRNGHEYYIEVGAKFANSKFAKAYSRTICIQSKYLSVTSMLLHYS